ncbi:MAG: hypothetical protein ORO03_03970, partial [Alphaproteobacteria bacterium]|nr:hypothetical protein [Alphaproteobacteria bacterium]
PYTEALLSAIPIPDPTALQPRVRLAGEIPSPLNIPKGCRFATRCHRKVGAICDTTPPPDRHGDNGHIISCHIPIEELAKIDTGLNFGVVSAQVVAQARVKKAKPTLSNKT